MCKETLVCSFVEGLCETVGNHVCTGDLCKDNSVSLDFLADVFVVDIDMLRAFMVTLTVYEFDSR